MGFLDKDEEEIYKLIKEFFKKKSFITITDILDFLNYQFGDNSNLNRNKIEIIIKNLNKKKYILPYSAKLVRDVNDKSSCVYQVPKIYNHIP